MSSLATFLMATVLKCLFTHYWNFPFGGILIFLHRQLTAGVCAGCRSRQNVYRNGHRCRASLPCARAGASLNYPPQKTASHRWGSGKAFPQCAHAGVLPGWTGQRMPSHRIDTHTFCFSYGPLVETKSVEAATAPLGTWEPALLTWWMGRT